MPSTTTKVYDGPLSDLLHGAVAARVTSPQFRALLKAERATRSALDAVEGDPATAPAQAHQALDAHRAARVAVLDYRLDTARLLAMDSAPLPMPVPDGVVSLGAAEPGTVEWLTMRQGLLGGSDVGAICKVGRYGRSDYDDVRASKMWPALAQEHEGAPLLGDLWEPTLLRLARTVLADSLVTDVFTDKNTYSDGTRNANIDGFTLDFVDGLGPFLDAIIEAKVASHHDQWDNGAPEGYTLQVQHYLDVLGAWVGYIVANINDERLVVYRVTSTDRVPAGPDSVKKIGAEFSYDDVKSYALGLVSKWTADAATPPAPRARRVTPVTDALRDVWSRSLERGVVFVDLETTSRSPSRGHILEIGMVGEDGATFHRVYGAPSDHLAWNGTGAIEVHGITAQEVAGAPVLLGNDAALAEVSAFIDGRVVVAHNARFEESWLAEAGLDLDYVDSMAMFSALVTSGPSGNAMSDLCEWAGVRYADAHRALPDALMLSQAYERLRPLVVAAARLRAA